MLGVNRPTVTTAAIALQSEGFINYVVRGKITILRRQELEHFACDCYRTIKRQYNQVQSKES